MNRPSNRILWILCITLLVASVPGVARAELVAGWTKVNASTGAQPYVAAKMDANMAAAGMYWKTNFYEYNDNSWFYIEPFCTNPVLTSGVSATNQFSGANKPITNYVTFVFNPAAGYKISFTNMVFRGQNDERCLRFYLRSSSDGYVQDVVTGSTDHTTKQMVPRAYCSTTNQFMTYTNILNLMNVTNRPVELRWYGMAATSRWVYWYMTNVWGSSVGVATNYMIYFEGKVERVVDFLPSSGPLVGGNFILLTNACEPPIGNGSDITNVRVGTANITSFHGQGTNWVSWTMPPGDSPGAKDVVVYSVSTGMAVFTTSYTYNPTGVILGASPSEGDAAGGYSVAIVGSNLCNGTDVTNVVFGGNSLVPVSQSATQVVVTAPAGSGTVDVRVCSTSYGESFGASLFTYTNSGPQDQTITFDPIAPQKQSVSVGLAATASSGLEVTFAVGSGPGNIEDGTNLAFSAIGTVEVIASQAGDASFNPAPDVTNTIHVYALDTYVGPYAGGNTITITNGGMGTITNLLVGGVAATIQGSGANWVTITAPATGSAGVKDIVIQTDTGDVTLPGAYTVNPAGAIGSPGDWSHWIDTVGMPVSLSKIGVGVLSNVLFAVGGSDYSAVRTNVYCFDGTNWTEIAGLPADRERSLVGVVDGSLYAAGGQNWMNPYTNVYRYTGSGWTEVPGMPTMIWEQAGVVYGGALYAIGGEYYGIKTNVFRFDGTSWAEVAGLPVERKNLGVAVLDGYLYAAGGEDWSGQYTNVYRFNGTSWTEVAGLPTTLTVFAMAELDGALYAAGGMSGAMMEEVFYTNVYRFDGSSWTQVAGLPATRRNHSLAALNGALYSVGGYDLATNVYRYPATAGGSGVSPSSGSWTGGVEVVILGTNLCDVSDVTNVTLCGAAVTSITRQSDTQIVVVAGTGGPGLGDVRVFSTSFGETVKSNAFTYLRESQAPLTFTPTTPQTYLTTNVLSTSGGSGTGAVSYTVLSGPGLIVGGTSLTVTNGTGTISIRATKAQDDLYLAISTTSSVTAAKASQTINFPAISDQLTTNRVVLSATASSGLTVNYGISGPVSVDAGPPVVLSFTGTGTVRVVASEPGDANWNAAPSVTNTFNVTKATAGLTLNDLSQTYDGTPRVVTATTVPAGLTVEFTYEGSATAPTNAGSYAVTGVVSDVMYQGTVTDTLAVAKADQTINFPAIGDKVTTDAVGLSATASSGLAVSFNLLSGPASLSGGTNLSFTGAGSVSIVTSQAGDGNWTPAPSVTNTFNVGKATAQVYLQGLSHVYDGSAKSASATTMPAGLTVEFTYEGSASAPTNAGSYAVTGTVNDVMYQGVRTETLAVSKGSANVYLGDLTHTYDGSAKSASATTMPAGLTVTFTYDGNAWAPTNGGTYAATGTVSDANWAGTGAGTLTISKGSQTITFPVIADQLTTNKVGLAATASSGLGVSFNVLSGSASISDVTNLSFTGVGSVSIVASQAGDGNWTPAPSMTNTFNVTKATAGVTLNNLSQTYDGTPRVVTGTTIPAGMTVDITYDGSGTAPTGVGSYAITGVVNDVMYQGVQTGILDVAKATQSGLSFTPASPQTYNTTNGLGASGGQSSGGWSFTLISGTAEIVGGTNLWMQTGTGSAVVRATKAGDANWNEASMTGVVTAAKATQTINFPAVSDQLTTNKVGLAATASSGLGVSFAVVTGPAQIANSTNLSFTTIGEVGIAAIQVGNTNYSERIVTNTFMVHFSPQEPLNFAPASPQQYGTTNQLTTTGGSGSGEVVFSVVGGPGVLADGSNLVVTSGTGNVFISARKPDDAMYSEQIVTAQVVCAKADQTIAFPAIGDQVTTNELSLAATASSSLGVSFALLSGPAILADGTNLSFTAQGSVSIVASQGGDSNYNPAPGVTNTFNVTKTLQAALTFTPASPQTFNTTNTLTTSGGSGTGLVSYAVASGAGELVGTDGLKMLAGTGSVSVVATKAGDDVFESQSVTGTVVAAKAGQGISFAVISDQLTTNKLGLAATSDSGLSVSFSVFSGSATITGATNLSFTGAGSVSIVASQPGDDNWAVAPDVTNTFNVTKSAAAVTLTNLVQVYDGGAKAVLASTAPTGLVVDITYDGSFTAPTDVGSYVVTGTVNDLIYSGSATDTLTVSQGNQTIAFPQIMAQHVTNTLELAATANSGLPVSFAILSGPAVLADGTNVTFTDVGLVSVVASQVGDANWNAAADVTNTFRVRVGMLWTDYDGDQVSDLAVYKTTNGMWHIRKVNGDVLCSGTNFGNAKTVSVPGDYDGDGTADMAVYDETRGNWYAQKLSGELLMWRTNWGFAGATPVPGDYDGDGVSELAVYDEARGNWYVRTIQGDVLVLGTNWGFAGAVAVPGDYNGDGSSDLAVYDEARGNWFVRTVQGEILTSGTNWGFAGTTPVPGDYDADGTSDMAVYDELLGNWYIRSFNGPILLWEENWGFAGAVAVPGDYDGDGFADMAVYGVDRLAITYGCVGNWYIRKLNGDVLLLNENWGYPGTVPVNGE